MQEKSNQYVLPHAVETATKHHNQAKKQRTEGSVRQLFAEVIRRNTKPAGKRVMQGHCQSGRALHPSGISINFRGTISQ